ncbi:MAG: hypothetical protein IPP17_01025 [Bacteroidetes bacterium]|nr:hypothetical protein [Bacteroidota bacterium]
MPIFGLLANAMDTSLIDPQLLFPRLIADRAHAIYQRDLGRHMRLSTSQVVDLSSKIVTVPMLEDLAVQFVQDRERGFDFVRENDRQGDEVWDDMALIQQGFRNLKDRMGEDLQLILLDNGLSRIASGGKYEASFLLLSNLWLTLEAEFGTEMYAAIPCHNLLLVGKENDRNAILELQNAVRGVFFEEDHDSLLSKAIYKRLDGEWRIIATAF